VLLRIISFILLFTLHVFSEQIIFDYKKSFLNNGNIMLLIDPSTGNIVKANKKAASFYGYQIKLLEKMNIKNINTFTKEQVQQEMKNAKSEQRNYFIFNHRLADKSLQKVRVFSTPIKYKNKNILFSTIFPAISEQIFLDNFTKQLEKQVELQIEDIKQKDEKNIFLLTSAVVILLILIIFLLSVFLQKNKLSNHLKKSNYQLQLQREEFQMLFNFSPIAMAYAVNSGEIVNRNLKFSELFGYTEDDIPSMKAWFKKAYPNKEYRDKILVKWNEALGKVKKNEVLGPLDIKVTAKDDKVYDFLIFGIQFNDGIMAAFVNQTEQKKTHKLLSEQKEEFETIFNYAQDGIAVTNLEGDFLNVNRSFIDMSDFTKKELLTKNCNDLTAFEYKEKNKRAMEQAIKTGHVENFEKVCIVKNNKRVSVSASISLLPDNESLLFIIKDITSLKVLEEQSKLASMGEMIGNIAHQWRQPLSVITTSATGLQLKAEIGNNVNKEDISEFSSIIVKQADYLSNTIDNFRGFLKGEQIFKIIKVKEVLDYTLSLVEASIKNNNIRIIPNIDSSLEIRGSINELSEAFINILNNAKDILKENISGSHDRFIFVTVYADKNTNIIIEFKDSGGGVPSEVIKRVFEPYFTTKHQSVGTGLGLAMSDKIIRERYKGAFEVFNVEYTYNQKKYKGACFKITLPSE